MNTEDKVKIRELLFKRVRNAEKRSKIYQLAYVFADGDDESDEYWSSLYHYALPEMNGDLERDYRQFIAGKVNLPETAKQQGVDGGKGK